MGNKNTYKIAVIPGDGIGPEIVPAGIKVLNAASECLGFQLQYEEFPYGAGYYKQTGQIAETIINNLKFAMEDNVPNS